MNQNNIGHGNNRAMNSVSFKIYFQHRILYQATLSRKQEGKVKTLKNTQYLKMPSVCVSLMKMKLLKQNEKEHYKKMPSDKRRVVID